MNIDVTGAQVLAVPMHPESNDAEASTVREYLVLLLATMWKEGEGFSGKRPFGNSDWQWQVYDALAAASLISERDSRGGDILVMRAIEALGETG